MFQYLTTLSVNKSVSIYLIGISQVPICTCHPFFHSTHSKTGLPPSSLSSLTRYLQTATKSPLILLFVRLNYLLACYKHQCSDDEFLCPSLNLLQYAHYFTYTREPQIAHKSPGTSAKQRGSITFLTCYLQSD